MFHINATANPVQEMGLLPESSFHCVKMADYEALKGLI